MPLLNTVHLLTVREFGAETLRALARAEKVVRVRRGAYRGPIAAETPWAQAKLELLARCLAVADRLTTTFAFSHLTAAALRGWPVPLNPGVVELVQVVKPTRPRAGDIRRHHRPSLATAGNGGIEYLDTLPVTGARRTLLDCLCALDARDGLVLADAAFRELARSDPFDHEGTLAREAALRASLLAELEALGPIRYARRAREVLKHATGLSASPGESRTRWTGLAIGLPVPVCQWEIWVGELRYFSDLAWLKKAADWAHRAITFEYDGVGKYGGSAAAAVGAFADEKRREDDIRSSAVAVHRVTKERLANPRAAGQWMLSKFPPSTRAALTPRPLLQLAPLAG